MPVDAPDPRFGRRSLLLRLLRLGTAPVVLAALPRGLAAQHAEPAVDAADRFMELAFEMKQAAVTAGDQAHGAVLVRGDEVVGEGPSRVINDGDPTAHAEMVAIRDAARRLKRRRLDDCVLFSTSQPCRMCETAAYWAGVRRLRYTRRLTDGGAPRYCEC